ncbi:hypothetical protein GCM10011335_28170 [Aureimonas glaciei]|uniref:Uncharacterized protein n=1 Tax=Aureimonas glaciei TaxID=1776957 RepID=A0A916XZN6_9HYPH|nr:hypothetical protein GCM10011335_28170 [Aureimonas glaciei]
MRSLYCAEGISTRLTIGQDAVGAGVPDELALHRQEQHADVAEEVAGRLEPEGDVGRDLEAIGQFPQFPEIVVPSKMLGVGRQRLVGEAEPAGEVDGLRVREIGLEDHEHLLDDAEHGVHRIAAAAVELEAVQLAFVRLQQSREIVELVVFQARLARTQAVEADVDRCIRCRGDEVRHLVHARQEERLPGPGPELDLAVADMAGRDDELVEAVAPQQLVFAGQLDQDADVQILEGADHVRIGIGKERDVEFDPVEQPGRTGRFLHALDILDEPGLAVDEGWRPHFVGNGTQRLVTDPGRRCQPGELGGYGGGIVHENLPFKSVRCKCRPGCGPAGCPFLTTAATVAEIAPCRPA